MIRFFGLVMFVLLLFSCAKEKSVDTMGDNPTLPPPASTDTCLLTRFVQGTHVGDDTILRISYNSDNQITTIIDSSESANDGYPINFVYNSSKQLTEIQYPQAGDKYRFIYNGDKPVLMITTNIFQQNGDADTLGFLYNNNNQVSQTISGFGYSEFQWNAKGNIIRIQNEGNRYYTYYKYVIIDYTNDPNALRPLAIANFALNLTDFENFAFRELGWCANNVEKMTFYDDNDQVTEERLFTYEKDSTGKITRIVSITTREGDPTPDTYTYNLQYTCR